MAGMLAVLFHSSVLFLVSPGLKAANPTNHTFAFFLSLLDLAFPVLNERQKIIT